MTSAVLKYNTPYDVDERIENAEMKIECIGVMAGTRMTARPYSACCLYGDESESAADV